MCTVRVVPTKRVLCHMIARQASQIGFEVGRFPRKNGAARPLGRDAVELQMDVWCDDAVVAWTRHVKRCSCSEFNPNFCASSQPSSIK